MPPFKRSNWWIVLNIFIVLPLWIFFYKIGISETLNVAFFNVTGIDYVIIFIVFSIPAYIFSKVFRDKLYVKGDIPVYRSMFFAQVLILPFIFAYTFPTPAQQGSLILLETGILISASIIGVAGATFKKKDFAYKDNLTSLFGVVFGVIFLTVISALFLIFSNYALLGIAFGYYAFFSLFQLAFYFVQMLAYKEGLSFQNMLK